tara:strand:- start:679 stop:2217 length:1539 start_codon:yes stop_codon:yes gene_type:complete
MQNRESDIQNIYDSYVLLSDKKWNTNSDCSIEIVLNEQEIAKLQQIQNNYFLSLDCYPISRTQKIIFNNKEKGETVIWNINSGAAFIPKWAIYYEDKIDNETIELTEKIEVKEDNNKDIEKSIKSFNRLMGGFAFMRVSLLSDLDLDVPENYLSAISFFNKKIEKDLLAQNIDVNEKYHNIFTQDYHAFQYLAKDITLDMVTQIAKKEKVKLQKKFNTILFNDLNPNTLTYKLGILATYGKGKVKSDHDIVSGLFSELKQEYVEELALVYGLSNGYKALRNKYESKKGEIDVKFNLNSALQVYTIESLFQYAFNDKVKSDTFNYLDLSIINEIKNQKKEGFLYANILGNYYAFAKPVKEKINIQSLIRELQNVIVDWFKKKELNIEESKVTESAKNLIKSTIDVNQENTESSPTMGQNPQPVTQENKTDLISTDNEEDKKLESKGVFKEDEPVEILLFDNSQELSDEIHDSIQLNKLSVKELKELCKKSGYKGYSKMNKKELLEFILDNQNQ